MKYQNTDNKNKKKTETQKKIPLDATEKKTVNGKA